MPKSLNDALIRATQPPEKGQITLTDASLQNFALRISQGGSKTFVVLLGKGKRQTIGRYPLISLADARAEAKRILAEKTLGRIRPDRVAFEVCVASFLADCATRLKPSTLRLYRYHLERDFPFARKPIADVTPRQILTQLASCTPSMKEHAARIGRTFFQWAIRNHLLDTSPMARIAPPARGASRDRVLSNDELRAILAAARRLPGPFPAIVQLAIRTGQRRSQLAALEWAWIDEAEELLTFPAEIMKGNKAHTIPVSDTVLSLLAAQPKISDRYIFPASRERRTGKPSTVFAGWSKAKVAFDKECGVQNWGLHDARRTLSTVWASLDIPQHLTDRYLSHVPAGNPVSMVYNRFRYIAQLREAILKYDAFLDTIAPPEA